MTSGLRRVATRCLPLAKRAAVAVMLGLFVACSHAGVATDELTPDDASGLRYLEVLTGGAAKADPVPIVIALHGLGDHPETFRLLLDQLPVKARVVFPRGPIPRGRDGFSWFTFRDADDAEHMAELSDGMRESAERVAKLITSVTGHFGGPKRVVVCGFSQGGMLSFALAAGHPEQVAAAIAISGFLPPPMWPAEPPKTRPLPRILALHGETDRLISLDSARWSVEALKTNGYEAKLRSWPKVGHAMPPEIRTAIIEAVASAVEELSPSGTLQGGQQDRKEQQGREGLLIPGARPGAEAPLAPPP